MKKSLNIVALSLAAAGLIVASSAHAAITWNWQFGGERGTFVTDGNAVGGTAAAGMYNLSDFTVTASPFGRQLGSLSSGQYLADGFLTHQLYSLQWNGSEVTMWDSAGINSFNWWVFANTENPDDYHFFGRDANQDNVTRFAGLYRFGEQLDGEVLVSIGGAVPESATWAMMIVGFGAAGAALRNGRRKTTVTFA